MLKESGNECHQLAALLNEIELLMLEYFRKEKLAARSSTIIISLSRDLCDFWSGGSGCFLTGSHTQFGDNSRMIADIESSCGNRINGKTVHCYMIALAGLYGKLKWARCKL